MKSLRLTLVAAALAAAATAVPALADPEPLCRLHWEKPTIGYDENGLPHTVTVERPYWVC